MSEKKQYIAFISYNQHDVKWAKWLQRRLEWYRLPAELHDENAASRYMRPVFRDRDELNSGILNDSIRQNLEASRYLVVVCSPYAEKSKWVNEEVKTFLDMGREERIIPFIVEGNPNDYSCHDPQLPLSGECFPFELRKWNAENPDRNILGIAVTDDKETNRNKAFIRLVSYMLGLEFDTLWRRHKRFVLLLATALASFAVLLLAIAYWFMVPVRVSVDVRDEPCTLPKMEQGVLKFNGGEYSLSAPDTIIKLNALPGYFRLRSVPITFHANRFYLDEKESIKIGAGLNQRAVIQLHRDGTFAIYAGTVYDGDAVDHEACPISGAIVTVGDKVDTTDANGCFHVAFPLLSQTETKTIMISHKDYQTYVREDESPGPKGKYLLHRH